MSQEKPTGNTTLNGLSLLLAETRKRAAPRAGTTKPLACATRHLKSVEKNITRPFRFALLGEPNSGKSSIANGIIGNAVLPAHPYANTRLLTRLYFSPAPQIHGLTGSGELVQMRKQTEPANSLIRIDIGLPVPFLKYIELLDFPAVQSDSARGRKGGFNAIDGAIWATVATQAWRESERSKWASLPARIRRRGILAVTNADLIRSSSDFSNVEARINSVAREHFAAVCFLTQLRPDGAKMPFPGGITDRPGDIGFSALTSAMKGVAQTFDQERLDKAIAITRRIARTALTALQEG